MPLFNTQVIADLFLELYSVLIGLSYLDPACLSLPPHAIPESRVQRFAAEMDPVALDLIQRLPYIKGLYPIMIAPGTKSKNLAYDLGHAQDPMELDGTEGDYVEKWSVCLTDGLDEWTSGWLVLDTRKSKFDHFFPPYHAVFDFEELQYNLVYFSLWAYYISFPLC
jgi:hypothetical protein